ncbi:multiple coagulation factor deficiency protein 2 homolog isoform X1 [Hyalella azteca]|uniref:Multiple coagulation factor deficiency protein 2 homolog isoform X1 n=1 Tax=Hyalella azteca TaxID=294128 RepID=A0A8B7N6U0_HYAAZ|nr:multiple coagulation factor deficiency protein 2 homolog isoform X1 [Hyalella azteca]
MMLLRTCLYPQYMARDRKLASLLIIIILCDVLSDVAATGTSSVHHSHHHMERHHTPTSKEGGGDGILHDQALLGDRQHMEEDLAHQLSAEQISKMSPGELEYHYFKVHDFDKNGKLDGLEILVAIGHVVHLPGVEQGIDVKQLPQITEMIDEVFEEADGNKDGYLSYYEYARTRR